MLKPVPDDGRCRHAGCGHAEAQYVVAVSLSRLGGKEEAVACRQHVGAVADALAESVGEWARRGVALAELGPDLTDDLTGRAANAGVRERV